MFYITSIIASFQPQTERKNNWASMHAQIARYIENCQQKVFVYIFWLFEFFGY